MATRRQVSEPCSAHQHQDVRIEGGVKFGDTVDEMDFAYLAKVTRLNVAVLNALARAPLP